MFCIGKEPHSCNTLRFFSIRECTERDNALRFSLLVLGRLSGNQALRYCSCTADTALKDKGPSNYLSFVSQKPIKCHTYTYPVGFMSEMNVKKSGVSGIQPIY